MCSTLNETEKIRLYFQNIVDRFDKIYSDDKSLWQLLIDKIFRRSMRKRFIITLKECGDIRDKTVLDIGCGSGRYSIAFAKMGAGSVTGIDFADNMLKKAEAMAYDNGVLQKCRFICGDFLTYDFKESYNICIAIGLFDYISQPEDFLKRMAELIKDKIIISFPVKWRLETISRKMRLRIAGCPVYFYTISKIKKLLNSLDNVKDYGILRLGRDYLVTIELKKDR